METLIWYNQIVMKKRFFLQLCSLSLIAALVLPMTGCGSKRRQEEYKRDGIEAMQEEKYDKALKCFLNALSQSGSVGREEKDLALYKASAQYKLGKSGEALKTLQGLLEFDQKDVNALYLMGLIYCDCNKPDKALSYLTKACSVSGKAALYENAYLSLINAGMSEEAGTFYDKMPKEARASKEVVRLRVIEYEKESDFSNALDCAESYLKQYPDDEDMTKEKDFLTTALKSVSDDSSDTAETVENN